jgi:hypothetical protein
MFRGLFKNRNRQAENGADGFYRHRPIFSAASGDYPTMRRAIAECGCFVLRGLFDPRALARIRGRAERLARTWDDKIARGDTKGSDDFVAGAFQAGHLPETQIGPQETWSDLTTGTPFDKIAKEVFGRKSRDYALRRSMLSGKQNPVTFHQDGFFMGRAPSFNFWTPLQDVGIDAPALEVVVGSGSPLIMNMGAVERIAAYVEQTYGQQAYWLPTLMAGDALVFTSMMFHRTQSSAEMSKVRYSLELRGVIKDRTLAIAGVPSDWSAIETLQEAPA